MTYNALQAHAKAAVLVKEGGTQDVWQDPGSSGADHHWVSGARGCLASLDTLGFSHQLLQANSLPRTVTLSCPACPAR